MCYISKVYQICDAYESGYGKGYNFDNGVNPYSADELREAYDIGYKKGEENRKEFETKNNISIGMKEG